MTKLLSRIHRWLRRREPSPSPPPPPLFVPTFLQDWKSVERTFPQSQASLEPIVPLNQSSATLALAMYQRLAEPSDDVVVSPFSLRMVLAMTLGGARAETAAELRGLLSAGDGDTDVHETLGRQCRSLQAFGADGSLGIANSLWIANAHPLTAGFEALTSAHYGSDIHSVDLASPATAVEMNRWVAERTFGRITDLIGRLDADSRLVLVNALAFRGTWATPFLPVATHDQPFTLLDGRRMLVPMMFNTMRVRYAERQDLQAVDLEYRGGRLSMLIVLPSADTGLSTLEHELSAPMIAALDANLRVREVHVSLPRFKVSAEHSLVPLLQSLGVRHSFDRDTADFSGINARRPPDAAALFVSDILQKAVVDVNEEGTEAVAATAVLFPQCAASLTAEEPVIPMFRADRPFLFAIRDRSSGEILFMGRVTGSRFDRSGVRGEADQFDAESLELPEFLRGGRRFRLTRGR
jgi:serpin B